MTNKNLYSRKNVNYKKWQKLKQTLKMISENGKMQLNAYIVKNNALVPIFDLSEEKINANDNLKVIKNNNKIYISDGKKFFTLVPRKSSFLIYELSILGRPFKLHYLKSMNIINNIFQQAYYQMDEANKLIKTEIDTYLMEENFEKDLGEDCVKITYSPKKGFEITIFFPRNDLNKIKEYFENYLHKLGKKIPLINTEYSICCSIEGRVRLPKNK